MRWTTSESHQYTQILLSTDVAIDTIIFFIQRSRFLTASMVFLQTELVYTVKVNSMADG